VHGVSRYCIIVRELLSHILQDWCSSKPPESDVNGHYHTGIALVLFQMVDQNVSQYCAYI